MGARARGANKKKKTAATARRRALFIISIRYIMYNSLARHHRRAYRSPALCTLVVIIIIIVRCTPLVKRMQRFSQISSVRRTFVGLCEIKKRAFRENPERQTHIVNELYDKRTVVVGRLG